MTSIQPMQNCTRFLQKHEKLYRLATKKLNDVELDREELSTKVDEANQNIGVLWFENNFLATINPTEGVIEIVDDEEGLVDSKFKKMNDQYDIHTAYAKLYKVSETYEKLYRLATKKLSDVKLDRKELSAKSDEAN